MAQVFDRTAETSTSTGTGSFTLGGALPGYRSFDAATGGANAEVYYAIVEPAGGAWEVGIGTYLTASASLTRATVLQSSAAGAKVNFPAGDKVVYTALPGERTAAAEGFLRQVVMTQSEYAALVTKDPNTIYNIIED